VPGSRPQEQIALLNWFIRSHTHVSALVLVADLPWCTQDASLPLEHPFPFWLYSESDIGYLRNLFSERSIERAFRRIGMALGWRERNRTAGYFDYEAWSRAHGRSFVPPPIPPRPESISPLPEPNLPFPAMDRLDRLLASLAQLPSIVLVMPPTYASLIPAAGTAEAAWLENCKSRLTRLAEGPQRRFIDRMVDGPATRNPENFVNELHMRDVLAREIETAIAAPLKQTKRVP
jgi:hypothetical protein